MLSWIQKSFALFALVAAQIAYAATPIGWHDSADTNGVGGWACDPDNFGLSIQVDVYDQFGYVGSTVANASRPDVGAAGVCAGTSNHGFNFPFSQSTRNLRDNQTHTFYAYGLDLSGGDFLLSGSPKSVFMPGDTPAYGFLDVANASGAAGWTCDPDNTNASLTVVIQDQFGVIGTTVANAYRPDLSGVCPGNVFHGFNFSWSQATRNIRDGQSHTISVFGVDSETGQQIQLGSSPQTITVPITGGALQALAAPSCGVSFSTGEQYLEPAGQGPGTNGILKDQWFMLARWQGMNEFDFVNNPVSYDVGRFTGVHGGVQRGVSPERSDGTAAVQSNCTTSGMLINTWSIPHRPVTGGWANDMLGYSFSADVRPFVSGGTDTYLVLKANLAVPAYVPARNTSRVPPGNQPAVAVQLGLFTYLRDKRPDHAAAPPIVVLAMSHASNIDSGWMGSTGFDYAANGTSEKDSTNQAKSRFPNWYLATPFNESGVCFVSAPITPSQSTFITAMPDNQGQYIGSTMQPIFAIEPGTGVIVGDPNAPMKLYSVAITQANLGQIVGQINATCPLAPAGGYSFVGADWAIEYAGVIAETPVITDEIISSTDGGNYDVSRSSWGGNPAGPTPYGDTSKDQVAFAVRIDSPAIYRFIP